VVPRDAEAPGRGYFELRVYTVTSNKLDAVLERFKETVDPVRKRHGIETVGYWSNPGATNGGTFVYLMAASSRAELQRKEKVFGADPQFQSGFARSNQKHGKTVDQIVSIPLGVDASAKLDFGSSEAARAFDLRIYSIVPGKLDAFRARWRDHAVPIYERHGLHSVGWWVALEKDSEGHDQFVCLLAGKSLASIQQSISEFHKDPDWIRIETATEVNGKLRSSVLAHKILPADFSSIQ
jgi:hypothetical protein